MLEAAGLEPGDRVLEIGSGGYDAALAAELVGPAGRVVSVDIDPEIVANARTALATAGYPQVEVVCADGEYGHEPGAAYDAVVVTVNVRRAARLARPADRGWPIDRPAADARSHPLPHPHS
jgi:protein-L-isoaspartate(D-aspartate) O-methyltransferase